MTVRYLRIPLKTDQGHRRSQSDSLVESDAGLAHYLREAEASVDAMSDAELDAEEAKVNLQIQAMLAPSRLAHSPPKSLPKIRHTKRKSYYAKVFCCAAIIVLSILNKDLHDPDPWRIKGLVQPVVCEVTVFDENGRLNLTDKGYEVSSQNAVFVKSNCLGNPVLEIFADGQWRELRRMEAVASVLTENDEEIDFRAYLGERLRLKMWNGVSEEFLLYKPLG